MVLTNGGNTYTTIAQNAGKSVTNTLAVNLPVSATLLYDNNGNLTNDGLRSFAYDPENELANVQMAGQWQSAFVYDGLGRRRIERDYAWSSGSWVRRNEVHYVYDGRLILQERDASNNVVVTYTRGRDLAANKVAIQNLANQGVTIIDLGRDPLRLFLVLFTQRSPKSFRQTQFR
jgi:YD repeat-containing protein